MRYLVKLCVFLIFAFSPQSFEASSRNITIETSDQILRRELHAYMQSYSDFSGAVLVAKEGRIILSKGYGFANYELNVPNLDVLGESKKIEMEKIKVRLKEGRISQILEELKRYHQRDPEHKGLTDCIRYIENSSPANRKRTRTFTAYSARGF